MSTPAPVTWTVTAVTPDQDFGPNAAPVNGKRLTFQTSTGYEGTVFVPASAMASMDGVRQLIEQEVRQVTGLQGLSGTIGGG